MSSVEIVDNMIAAMPDSMKNKKPQILLAQDLYDNLCVELNRKVRSYKGLRCGTHSLCPMGHGFLGLNLFVCT